MRAAEVDIIIEEGSVFSQAFIWYDENDVVHDITGYTAKMEVRNTYDGSVIVGAASSGVTGSFDGTITIDGSNGRLTVSIPSDDTRDLSFTRGVWDLEVSPSGAVDMNAAADVIRLCGGFATLSREATK